MSEELSRLALTASMMARATQLEQIDEYLAERRRHRETLSLSEQDVIWRTSRILRAQQSHDEALRHSQLRVDSNDS